MYIISVIAVCAIYVSLRYLENKRINDPPHYNSPNKSSDNLSYDEGSDVKSIQKKLVNAEYPIKIDGVYGERTAEAVEKFQKSRKVSANRMLLWRGTTEELEGANPVLGNGEIVFDRSTHAFKVGDGKKAFTELDYISGTHKETSDTK